MVRVGIERRDGDMRHHHGVDASGDRLAEWRKLDRIQMCAVPVHASHTEMRVSGGIAVARKMLHRGQHASLVRSLDIGGNQIADLLGIFSKRPRVDDGIRRIRVDVGIRKEIPVNANGPRFLRRNAAERLRVCEIAIGAKRHSVGKGSGP